MAASWLVVSRSTARALLTAAVSEEAFKGAVLPRVRWISAQAPVLPSMPSRSRSTCPQWWAYSVITRSASQRRSMSSCQSKGRAVSSSWCAASMSRDTAHSARQVCWSAAKSALTAAWSGSAPARGEASALHLHRRPVVLEAGRQRRALARHTWDARGGVSSSARHQLTNVHRAVNRCISRIGCTSGHDLKTKPGEAVSHEKDRRQ